MAKSDYLENASLNKSLRNVDYTVTTVYVALYTSNPTDADTGTEVAGAIGYSRQTATFTAPSGGSSSNTADIEFGPATASWGTVSHVGLRDNSPGGNLLYHGPLDTPIAVDNTESLRFSAGNLSVTET